MNPRVLMALTLVAASIFAAVLVVAVTSHDDPEAAPGARRFAGAVVPKSLQAPDFSLRDQDGDRITMRRLRGKPVLVSFLYSHCEDTCPTQAVQMRAALDELGTDVPAIALSVDPGRDTEASARAFLGKQKVTGRIDFVLGRRSQLAPLWKAYAVEPQLDQLEHSARFVLVDPKGRQRVSFPIDQATPENLAHDLRLLSQGA